MGSISIHRSATDSSILQEKVLELCERAAASAVLFASIPVLAAAGAAIALRSGRSPFIAHRRVGQNGSTLWMLKLRTMWDASSTASPQWVERIEDERGPALKGAGDVRITSRFAAFCRRHSIDELPQLWHVVRGEMSLVGPRPLTARELREYYAADAAEVLSVKPGMAGLWQVSGRNRLTYDERRRFDLCFVRRRSIGLYWKILVRAVLEVWSGTNTL